MNPTFVEWFGVITGLTCVYLTIKKNIFSWVFAILNSFVFIILFTESKLYGNAILQLYFLGTSIYGLYYWSRSPDHHQQSIKSLSTNQNILLGCSVLILTFIIRSFLISFTDSDVPLIDAFCTSLSFIAQFLLTRKILQNWLLWIIADAVYIPLYFYKDLYLTGFLYVIFLGLAAYGYSEWKKSHLFGNLK